MAPCPEAYLNPNDAERAGVQDGRWVWLETAQGRMALRVRYDAVHPEGKAFRLLDFTDRVGDVADPWYTGNFEATYRDVKVGCEGLLARIAEKE